MRMRKALKNILLFEFFYKIFIICFANPLLDEIYQTYVASEGLTFNKDMISTFVSVKGIFIFVTLFLCAAVLIFYEFSVVINIIELCRKDKEFTLLQVIKGSVWNFRALKGKTLIPASLCFVLVLPYAGIGWQNSLVLLVEVPYFIIGEMTRSTIGIIGVIAIYGATTVLYFLFVFVPVYMVLEQKTIGKAFIQRLRHLKHTSWKNKSAIMIIYLIWYLGRNEIAKFWRLNRLSYKDFDLYIFKYFVHSQAFKIDFAFWMFTTVLFTITFAVFAYFMVSFSEAETREEVLYSQWEGDAGVVLHIIGKHMSAGFRKISNCLKRKRYKLAFAVMFLFLFAYIYSTIGEIPYIHKPFAIGHRGCKAGIENSMEAIRAADAYGADYAEIDVQLSKDGVPVVVHDGNLWRLGGEPVNVTDLTLKELKAIVIRDKDHPDERTTIPTLEEVIQFAKDAPNQMGLLIELKSNDTNAETLANAVIELVERYDFGNRAMFMSLYYEAIYPISKEHPEWWTGYCVFGSSGDIDDSVWLYDIDFIAGEESQITNRLVMQAREHSLPVYVWTVYDEEKMRQYLEMGVTGIISDFPETAIEEIKKFNKKNGTAHYHWQGEGYPKGESYMR